MTGARQTGKTTLAKAKHSELNYIMLIQTRAGLIGVEIKSRKTYAKADLRTMKKISQKLGMEWRGGLLVNQGNVLRKIDEPNIWVIPSRRLFI